MTIKSSAARAEEEPLRVSVNYAASRDIEHNGGIKVSRSWRDNVFLEVMATAECHWRNPAAAKRGHRMNCKLTIVDALCLVKPC
jgi:hypothetical protein